MQQLGFYALGAIWFVISLVLGGIAGLLIFIQNKIPVARVTSIAELFQPFHESLFLQLLPYVTICFVLMGFTVGINFMRRSPWVGKASAQLFFASALFVVILPPAIINLRSELATLDGWTTDNVGLLIKPLTLLPVEQGVWRLLPFVITIVAILAGFGVVSLAMASNPQVRDYASGMFCSKTGDLIIDGQCIRENRKDYATVILFPTDKPTERAVYRFSPLIKSHTIGTSLQLTPHLDRQFNTVSASHLHIYYNYSRDYPGLMMSAVDGRSHTELEDTHVTEENMPVEERDEQYTLKLGGVAFTMIYHTHE